MRIRVLELPKKTISEKIALVIWSVKTSVMIEKAVGICEGEEEKALGMALIAKKSRCRN